MIRTGGFIISNTKVKLKNIVFSPYLLLSLVPVIWSSNFIVGKVLVQDLPPFIITTGRFGVASLILLVLLYFRTGLRIPPRSLWGSIIILGITGVFAYNTLIYLGLRYTTSINSTIINSFTPVVITLIAVFWLKEQVSVKRFLGVFTSITGVLFIAVRGSWEVLMSLSFNPGDIIIFFNTFIWAVFSTLGKKVMMHLTPLETVTYSNIAGMFLLLPVAFWRWDTSVADSMNGQLVLGIIYLGVFASVIALLFWYYGISELGSSKAANFYNLIPVFAAIMAIIFLGEVIHMYHVMGTILVFAGVYIGSGYSLFNILRFRK